MSQQILILGGGYGGVLTALTARKYLSAAEAKHYDREPFPDPSNYYGIAPSRWGIDRRESCMPFPLISCWAQRCQHRC